MTQHERQVRVAMARNAARSSGVMGGPSGSPAGPAASTPSFDGLLVSWQPGSTAAERVGARTAFGLNLRESIHTAAMKLNDAGPLEWLDLPQGLSAEQAIANFSRRSGVAYIEPNWRLEPQATSNDPDYLNGSLWGMYGDATSPANTYGSQAGEAWAAGHTGSNNVYVGIIDEGYQYTHPELSANAGINSGEIAANGIDDDGNGYIDDIYGWDFFNKDSSIYDGTSDDHGTHVAGTIGAKGGNGAGVAGVNWDVKLLGAKFLGPAGGSTLDAILAVDYLTGLKKKGVNIVATNNSWGGGGFSQGLYDAINRANAANILFVAAAGNSSSSTPSYPAAYDLPNVISVASIDSNGALSSFSNFGPTWVDLGAPGGSINSTLPFSTYGVYSGTSMATPHVSGALALLASVQPNASMAQLKAALLDSVVATPSLAGKTATGGRLDVMAAINRLNALMDPAAPTYAISGPSALNEGTTLAFSINTTNVADNTTLYWRLSGVGINTADFSGLTSLEGTATVLNGQAAFPATTLANDATTEGNESLAFDLFSDSGRTTKVAGTVVTINDTSQAAVITTRWGTTASNAISGTDGQDRLAGVLATGTTATAMGSRQIDSLTGLGSADVFLLGDSRGVFYDDRSAGNIGSADYARIQDFVPGTDKLQVRAGTRYVYAVGTNGLSLYWDRDNNGLLTSSGTNRDELVAVLTGVSAISVADLVGV